MLMLDDTTLATGSADKTIRLWSVSTYACMSVVYGHTGSITCLLPLSGIRASGIRLAASSEEGSSREGELRDALGEKSTNTVGTQDRHLSNISSNRGAESSSSASPSSSFSSSSSSSSLSPAARTPSSSSSATPTKVIAGVNIAAAQLENAVLSLSPQSHVIAPAVGKKNPRELKRSSESVPNMQNDMGNSMGQSVVQRNESARDFKNLGMEGGTSHPYCSGGSDGSLKIWQGNELLHDISRTENENLNDMVQVDHYLVTASGGKYILVYDLKTMTYETLLACHRDSVRCLLYLCEDMFVSGSLDGMIVVWELSSRRPLRTLENPKKYQEESATEKFFSCPVWKLALVDNSHVLAAIGKGFKMYNWQTGQCLLHRTEAHMSNVTDIIPMYGNKAFVTASEDASMRVWSTIPRQRTGVDGSGSLSGGGSAQNSMSDLRGGGKAKKPNAPSNVVCLGRLMGHSMAVQRLLRISNRCFVSCGGDCKVIVWSDENPESRKAAEESEVGELVEGENGMVTIVNKVQYRGLRGNSKDENRRSTGASSSAGSHSGDKNRQGALASSRTSSSMSSVLVKGKHLSVAKGKKGQSSSASSVAGSVDIAPSTYFFDVAESSPNISSDGTITWLATNTREEGGEMAGGSGGVGHIEHTDKDSARVVVFSGFKIHNTYEPDEYHAKPEVEPADNPYASLIPEYIYDNVVMLITERKVTSSSSAFVCCYFWRRMKQSSLLSLLSFLVSSLYSSLFSLLFSLLSTLLSSLFSLLSTLLFSLLFSLLSTLLSSLLSSLLFSLLSSLYPSLFYPSIFSEISILHLETVFLIPFCHPRLHYHLHRHHHHRHHNRHHNRHHYHHHRHHHRHHSHRHHRLDVEGSGQGTFAGTRPLGEHPERC